MPEIVKTSSQPRLLAKERKKIVQKISEQEYENVPEEALKLLFDDSQFKYCWNRFYFLKVYICNQQFILLNVAEVWFTHSLFFYRSFAMGKKLWNCHNHDNHGLCMYTFTLTLP
jgi:hypothetical protein